MRIAATCDHCGREFLLFQLYNAGSFAADRCPHCSAHLGIVGIAPLAASADQALTALVSTLREIAGRHRGFHLDVASVRDPVNEALAAVAPGSGEAAAERGRAA